jgi:hypothetical protein
MNQKFSNLFASRRLLSILLGVTILFGCGGCEIITLATVSTVLDIAGTAITSGPEVFSMGKLDTALMADYGEIQKAVRRAAGELHLHLVRDRQKSKTKDIWDFQLQDDLKAKIEVTVERRSPMLCKLQVNVGLFGSEPTARLIMHRIESHLPPAATAPSAEK